MLSYFTNCVYCFGFRELSICFNEAVVEYACRYDQRASRFEAGILFDCQQEELL